MGACASKPNVLNGEAPEVALESIASKDVGIVVQEEVNKEDIVIADHDDADKIPSLSNLTNNEEGKGSTEEKEEISVKASDVASEAKTEVEVDKAYATTCVDDRKIEEVKSETSVEKNVEEVLTPSEESENKTDDHDKLPTAIEVEKVVDDDIETDAATCTDDKKIEEVKSETSVVNNVVEVLTPSEESENKTDDQEKLSTAIEEAPEEKTVEEVKLAEKPTIEDKKIEEKPTVGEDTNSEELEKKKTEGKPAATKKSKFWWDK